MLPFKNTQCPSFAKWINELQIQGCSLLDIGCGDKWYYPFIQQCKITSIDIFPKCNPDFLLDVGEEILPFQDSAFDYVFMFDVIEHLEKKKGLFALEEAQRVCKKELFLLTPVIWNENLKCYNDKSRECYYQNKNALHLSLWGASDFNIGWDRISSVFNNTQYYFGKWGKGL